MDRGGRGCKPRPWEGRAMVAGPTRAVGDGMMSSGILDVF